MTPARLSSKGRRWQRLARRYGTVEIAPHQILDTDEIDRWTSPPSDDCPDGDPRPLREADGFEVRVDRTLVVELRVTRKGKRLVYDRRMFVSWDAVVVPETVV